MTNRPATTTALVKDLVRDQLKHTEKTLHTKRGEAETVGNKITQLNGRCVDLTNQIEEYANAVKQLTDERNSTINQVTTLADVKRDLDNQCLTLASQIDGYRDFMGQR